MRSNHPLPPVNSLFLRSGGKKAEPTTATSAETFWGKEEREREEGKEEGLGLGIGVVEGLGEKEKENKEKEKVPKDESENDFQVGETNEGNEKEQNGEISDKLGS